MPTNSVNLATYKAVKASKAVGSATQPVYIASDGTITACTAYGSASVASAGKWVTARTFTIGNTGKSIDGSTDVSWSKAEILGSGTTAQFLRGDFTWTSTLTGSLYITNNGEVHTQRTDYSHSVTPSKSLWMNIAAGYDSDNQLRSYLRQVAHSDDYQGLQIEARRTDGTTNWYNSLRLEINSTGGTRVVLGQPAAWWSALGLNAGTSGRLAYYSSTNGLSQTTNVHVLNNYLISSSRNSTSVDIRANGLIIWGQTYGNTAAQMLSNTAGVFRFSDGGPQIVFNTSNSWNAQAGALIFTDHDSAATGASFHFVTTEASDNNGGNLTVTAPRFRARKGLTIGQNSDNTSYNFALNGSGNIATGYLYINGGAGGIINGAATNGGINSIRIGDDVWLGDCNAEGIMGMKSTGNNCGFYFYNSAGTLIGYFQSINGSYFQTDRKFYIPNTGSSWIDGQRYQNAAINIHTINNTGSYFPWINQINNGSGRWYSFGHLNASLYWLSSTTSRTANGYDFGMQWVGNTGHLYANAVHSAVWNDYAECRIANTIEPGRVVTETFSGIMELAQERLMPACRIISDTYGMLIGETKQAKSPIAVSGRVLVYPTRPKNEYHLGDAVCSGPNGTVDIMTREEIKEYPDRIIGIVSEIPTYDIWYGGGTGTADSINDDNDQIWTEIPVNGRIWVYVR